MAEKFDYAEANADAVELISEFGQTMTIVKPDGTEKQTFTGVLLDLSYSEKQNALLVGAVGKVLTADDLKREADDDGDRVIINKVRYAVVATEAMRPAGVDVYFAMYVRR